MSAPKFGKFTIIGHLGTGGMAEVFKARLGGIGGFDKVVVVKRILPSLASDPEFVKMFLDEARLAANLTHPNIVQVFEIDEVDGQPYMAMEYVDGHTFSRINKQARREGKQHMGHMANIIAGVCEGLSYAHNAIGPDGAPLGLVHRDVSPQNIMVTREGSAKLLDFGVAKANGRLASTTQVGTLKGKLKYMPPEQVRSAEGTLDQRADVFGAGVCLYEVTTGQHPYGGKDVSEITLLRNIMQGTFKKPSEFDPEYPKALEDAVVWAIQPDPDKRCPSARDFHDALKQFIASAPAYNSGDRAVGQWLSGFQWPVQEDKGLSAPLAASLASPVKGAPGALNAARSAVTRRTQSLPGVDDISIDEVLEPPKRRWPLIAGVTATALGLALAAVVLLRPTSRPEVSVSGADTLAATKTASNNTAKAYLEEAERFAQQRRYRPALDMLAKARDANPDDPTLAIRLARLSDEIERQSLLLKAKAALANDKASEVIESAKIVLDGDPENKEALALIASARQRRSTTTSSRPAAAPTSSPAPSTSISRSSPRPVVRERDGRLSISSNPPGLVYLDDAPIGRTPIRNRSVSPGEHTIQIRQQGYIPAEANVNIQAGKDVSLVMPLTISSTKPLRTAVDVGLDGPSTSTASNGMPPAAPATSAPPTPVVSSTQPSVSKPIASLSPNLVNSNTTPSSSASTSTPSGTSSTPKKIVAAPRLPKAYTAPSGEDVVRMLSQVAQEAVREAGVSNEFAVRATAPLAAQLRDRGEKIDVFPSATYYFLVREAALGHDAATAGRNLRDAYDKGDIVKFRDLPTRK